MRRDLGDFQTPGELVRRVLETLSRRRRRWTRVLEPTCGTGNFIAGLLAQDRPPEEIIGVELQQGHIEQAQARLTGSDGTLVTLRQADLFKLNLKKELAWRSKGDLLVVGNPPWITNTSLGKMASDNRPVRSNTQRRPGLEAMTGESNFDLAEAVWLKLLGDLADEDPTIALLCKTSVARRVLVQAQRQRMRITGVTLHAVDARKWFQVSADACLLALELTRDVKPACRVLVFPGLEAKEASSEIGLVGDRLVADLEAHRETAFIDGSCPLTWRQGIKHDAARVFELRGDPSTGLVNGHGERVEVESEVLYPLLKGSDLGRDCEAPCRRWLIVTQTGLGQETEVLRDTAPRLWRYLEAHADELSHRRSAVYRGRPPYSMFGVGEYAFAPHKVAISGLHKEPRFRLVAPYRGKPWVLDDTSYFTPLATAGEAALAAGLLNHPLCLRFLSSIVFKDAKRPVTKRLLQRIDLEALRRALDPEELRQLSSPASASWPVTPP